MSRYLNSFAFCLSASLIATTCSAYGTSTQRELSDLDTRIRNLEKERQENGIGNPSVNPIIKDNWGMDFEGEFLDWKLTIKERFLGQPSAHLSTSDQYAEGKVILLNPHWAYGVRLGIGVALPHDGWDIHGYFTKIVKLLDAEESNTTGIMPILPNGYHSDGIPTLPTSLVATGLITFNMFDIEIGRAFYTSKFFTMRPFGGIRNLWFKERAYITYSGGHGGGFYGDDNIPAQVSEHSKLMLIGLRAGLGTNWILGAGFSIYAKPSFTILYGGSNQSRDFIGARSTNESLYAKGSQLYSEFQGGLAYDKILKDDYFGVQVKLGWNQSFCRDLTQADASFSSQGYNISLKFFY